MWVRGWDKSENIVRQKSDSVLNWDVGNWWKSQMGSTESQLRLRSVCLCTAGRLYRFQKDILDIHGVHGPGLRWNLRVARELSNVPNGPEKRHRTTGISIWKAYEVGSTGLVTLSSASVWCVSKSHRSLRKIGNYSYQPTYNCSWHFNLFWSLVMLNCDLWLQCSSNTMHPWSMQVTNHQSPNPFQTQLPYPPLQISVAKEWT